MESTQLSHRAQRIWLAISILLFLVAVYRAAIGYREPLDWAILVGMFSNVVVFLWLRKNRARDG